MAKKKAAAAKSQKITSKPRKIVPAIYPQPEPVELPPRKIVAVDVESRTIILEGETPPELATLAELENWRINLTGRLKQYADACGRRVIPFMGNMPKRVTNQRIERKLRTTKSSDLSDDAPAEAHHALLTIKTMYRMVDELIAAGDYPDSVDRAICWAIDLGQLLERGQTQIDHGDAVDRGRKSIKATIAASMGIASKKQNRSETARVEYERRLPLNPNRTPTDVINEMAGEKLENGKPKWGSVASLNRWKTQWCTIKSTK